MSSILKIATKTDDEKLDIFKERLSALYNCNLDTLKTLFSNRPSDPLLIGFDKTISKFAISFDGNIWKCNIVPIFEIYSAVTIPLRGSVWKSIKSYEFFIVIEYANLRSIKPNEEPPFVVYMDVNGNVKTMHIVKWFENMVSYDKKLL